MLIAGAVCPHPPLLIPAALGAAGSDPPGELRKVAAAAGRAVAGLAAARAELLVVVGGGAAEREYGADAAGGLHAFGVEVTVGAGEPVLPLSLTVGRWLLEHGGILEHTGTRAQESPGAPDAVAQDYDDEVAEALAAADARWLARLDPALDDELVVAGRAAWQVLAGAAGGHRMDGRLLCMSAPYGVTYLVASWEESRTD